MTFSVDLRWRAIVLVYVYNIDRSTVSSVLGVSARSQERWYTQFRKTGNVSSERKKKNKTSRWPPDVCNFVKKYVTANPCFYFEELREEQRANFSDLLNISDSSICRALRFDLGLTRKVLTKRASESIPRERREYVQRLLPYYCGPDQRVSLTKRRRTLGMQAMTINQFDSRLFY
ncbi:hypothetical protein PPTG_07878 [Phytophthora nicotianae INRA-310]|uniref:Transposase Tc1-like domain-containing protein n=1 Tax=Phytophthora nicotianae (strain INRA-310) TaxID=761204 RepID=W2QP11_PHYN3|nr:hypothetical protein PPTG_07878 [Phytophthora nicotianae INRA-310]ETN14244.1 hypothetical protein PPTG_07878 [Phytophthora nicotianae INRA-310]